MDDIITAENTMKSATLKGLDQTLFDSRKPFCCVLPFDYEEFVAQIGSDEVLEVEISVSLIIANPLYQI